MNLGMTPSLDRVAAIEPQAPGNLEARAMRPIFEGPGLPMGDPEKTVYFPRTNHLAGLPLDKQVEALVEVMKQVGPTGRIVLEGNGTYGLYTNELSPALTKALEQVPENQRPKIEMFASGGRPLADSAFGQAIEGIPQGVIGRTTDQNVTRLAANWGNQEVWNNYKTNELDKIIAFSKANGASMSSDDHAPAVNPNFMGTFKGLNGIDAKDPSGDAKVQKIIAGRLDEIASSAREAGVPYTLSLVGDFYAAGKYGVNPLMMKEKLDGLEFQLYRQNPAFEQNLNNIYRDLSKELKKGDGSSLSQVQEIRIALNPAPDKKPLTKDDLIEQQRLIEAFKVKVQDLYKQAGLTPPEVNPSLFPYKGNPAETPYRGFYK